jgi:hypothetical protein
VKNGYHPVVPALGGVVPGLYQIEAAGDDAVIGKLSFF